MKLTLALVLLAMMSVSCGKKNSSGGGGNDETSDWDALEDNDGITNISYEQEQKIGRAYLKALRQVFKEKSKQIRSRVGQYNHTTIKNRLAQLQVTTERRVMEEIGTRQVVSSYFDGFSMKIYIGTEETNHSWRYLLKKKNERAKTMLYNDLLQLRTDSRDYRPGSSSDYSSSYEYYRSGRNRSYYRNRSNGNGNGSFYFNYRIGL